MKIVTAEQMHALDRAAMVQHGIPSLDLMERAGSGLARAVQQLAPEGMSPVIVIAGWGNNGGDGLVAARWLFQQGRKVKVLLLGDPLKRSADLTANVKHYLEAGGDLLEAPSEETLTATLAELPASACILDCLFGTGLTRDVTGSDASAIDAMNASRARVVSADIPSGLHADLGEPMGRAVHAHGTITFGLPKRGLFLGQAGAYVGRLEVIDIGIPKAEVEKLTSLLELIEPCLFPDLFRHRARDGHKGTFGHVVIMAGHGGHLGAGYLSSLAALRSGCGLVTYALPKGAFERFDARYPEIMCEPIEDGGRGAFASDGVDTALQLLAGKQVLGIGPALGTSDETRRFVNALLTRANIPAVVDADALNILDLDVIKHRAFPTILTPHPGEMARLVGSSTQEVQAARLEHARSLALKTGALIVLKGHQTVVASPEGHAAINATGNPGMGTAGMGDALVGIIASFIAQHMELSTAVMAAVFLHGLAADRCTDRIGERALITSDLIEEMPHLLKELEEQDMRGDVCS